MHTQRRITTETAIKRSVTIQSSLVISNSKGLAEKLRDIRTSTYQILRIQGKITRKPHLTNLYIIGLLKLELYQKYCGKEEKLLLGAISPLIHNIFYLLLDFLV